jgi:anti-anti-sigma factor
VAEIVEFEEQERHGYNVIGVQGRLNLNSVDDFRATVTRAISEGRVSLLIDLRAAESVDSTGLGALVWAATRARREGGDLHIANANEGVRLLLERANVTKMLPLEAEPGSPGGGT